MELHANNPTSVSQMQIPSRESQKPDISSDFQTFLRMLTTQMQNQNPLEPIEASDFAVQLATFSGVEQQVRTNDLLSQLTSRMGLSELANWVGREALSSAPQFLDGTPLRLVLPEASGADRAELILRDLDGNEAGRFAVPPGRRDYVFEVPQQSEGGPSSGTYHLEMASFRAGEQIGIEPVLGYARIIEARSDAGRVALVLEGGRSIDSDTVVGLRE